VKLDFSRLGKPTDNAIIESFNGRLRQEYLNEHWFLSMEDAQQTVDWWRLDYNTVRPHSALGNLTPCEFAKMHKTPRSRSLLESRVQVGEPKRTQTGQPLLRPRETCEGSRGPLK
jgi:putative transposase